MMNTKYTMEELRNSLYSGLICDVLDKFLGIHIKQCRV